MKPASTMKVHSCASTASHTADVKASRLWNELQSTTSVGSPATAARSSPATFGRSDSTIPISMSSRPATWSAMADMFDPDPEMSTAIRTADMGGRECRCGLRCRRKCTLYATRCSPQARASGSSTIQCRACRHPSVLPNPTCCRCRS